MPPRRPKGDSGGNGKYVLFGILGFLLIAGIIAGIILLISSRRASSGHSTDEDSAKSKTATEEVSMSDADTAAGSLPATERLEDVKSLPSGFGTGNYVVTGWLSDLPCSVDLYMDSDGSVSGQFCNVLYDVVLPVSGQLEPSGKLSLNLGSGSTASHMELTQDSPGSRTFSGAWGKNRKPVILGFSSGSRASAPGSHYGTPITIKGGGMTTHGVIYSSGGELYLYFPDQPEENRMPLVVNGNTAFIRDPGGNRQIANFNFPGVSPDEPCRSTLYICNGKEFEITVGS